jgi:hypothetical protein
LRGRVDPFLGGLSAVTAGLLAAAAFLLMLDSPVQFPSVEGAPGLPNLYVPAIVWAGATFLFKRVGAVVEAQMGRIVAAALAAVCVVFVWSSLASPTHQTCAESDGEDCVRYEVEAGPDTGSAFMWGIGAYLLIAMALPRDAKATTDQREFDDGSEDE